MPNITLDSHPSSQHRRAIHGQDVTTVITVMTYNGHNLYWHVYPHSSTVDICQSRLSDCPDHLTEPHPSTSCMTAAILSTRIRLCNSRGHLSIYYYHLPTWAVSREPPLCSVLYVCLNVSRQLARMNVNCHRRQTNERCGWLVAVCWTLVTFQIKESCLIFGCHLWRRVGFLFDIWQSFISVRISIDLFSHFR